MVPIFKLLAPSQYVNDRDRRTIREFEMDEHEHELDARLESTVWPMLVLLKCSRAQT